MKNKILILLLILATCFPLSASAQTKPSILQIEPIATIAALRATGATASTTDELWANVVAYSSIGDGGGGNFYWDYTSTAADNAGTIINPTINTGNGRWIRDCPTGVINVADFGAVGDAVIASVAYNPATHSGGVVGSYPYSIHEMTGTDNSTAFENAWNAVGDGDTFYIPAGNYLITSSSTTQTFSLMDASDLHNVSVKGDGMYSSKICLYQDLTTYSMWVWYLKDCTNITFKDFGVDFQGIGYPTDSGTPQCRGAIAHVGVTSGGVTDSIDFRDCYFRLNHPLGSYFGSGDTSVPDDDLCKLIGITLYGDYGSAPAAATNDLDPSATAVTNCSVVDCIFDETQARTIWCWMTEGTAILGNKSYKGGGVKPNSRNLHYNKNIIIQDNYFEAEPSWGDGVTSAPVIAVSSNNGNYVNTGVSVSNNRVRTKGNTSGIYMTGCSSPIIKDNYVYSVDPGPGSSFVYAGVLVKEYNPIGSANAGLVINPTVYNNLVVNYKNSYGVFVSAASDGIIANNIVSVASFSIFARCATGTLLICDNRVNSGGTGIYVARGAPSVFDAEYCVGRNLVSTMAVRGLDYSFGGSGSASAMIFESNSVSNCAVGMRYATKTHMYIRNTMRDNAADFSDMTSATAELTAVNFGSQTIWGFEADY